MDKASVRCISRCFPSSLLLLATVGIGWSTSVNPLANDPPPLTPPPLPGPATGTSVYSGGAVLRNISNQNAEDVRLSFRIPTGFLGLASENINQGSIVAGITQTMSAVLTFGNQLSSEFDQDILLKTPGGVPFVVPPHQPGAATGDLNISVLLDSKNTNGVFWRTSTLTDANGNPIPTKFFSGTFVVTAQSPLTYTFTNGGSADLLVDSIVLGSSLSLIDAQAFSPSMLAHAQTFPQGVTLAPGDSIPITVPFELAAGGFLVADVLATGDPGTADPIALQFIDQHQSTPEPGTLALFAVASFATVLLFRKRRVR